VLYDISLGYNAQHHRQSDRQTDDIRMPTADHTATQYNLLKIDANAM